MKRLSHSEQWLAACASHSKTLTLKNMKTLIYRSILLSVLLLTGCDEDFLDKKSNKALVVPTTLQDLQAILDNSETVINVTPGIGSVASDEGFTTYSAWQSFPTPAERNTYIWAREIFEGVQNSDWNRPYQQIFYANVALDGVNNIEITTINQAQWNNVKGSALFVRAHALLQLAELFTAPYQEDQASSQLGLPIRRTADVSAPVTRSSQKETYDQIIADLNEALQYLPESSPYKTRPTIAAANALLARVSLFIGNFQAAESFASASLAKTDFLLDYNALNAAAARPIPRMNDEILYYATQNTYTYLTTTTTYVDTVLQQSYDVNDLRKTVFFTQRLPNRYTFKANYTGSVVMFGGIANDEVYITRAEARARLGQIDGALADLNALLVKRWKTDLYVPINETNPDALLSIILAERQKELLFRNVRYSDLRRLNLDSRFAKTLTRTLNNVEYSLPPNDPRYTFPIPEQEIRNSGIQQNPR